jgi:hypothetical protein
MSVPSENVPVTSTMRSTPLVLRHLPYFIVAAIGVVAAATMSFDGYVLNILMQATTFAIAVFGLSVVLAFAARSISPKPHSSVSVPMSSVSAPPIIRSISGYAWWEARCWRWRRALCLA